MPSPDGDRPSDKSVLDCEAECRKAGGLHLMRIGDVVWDVEVGGEGNVGKSGWDGSYLIVCSRPAAHQIQENDWERNWLSRLPAKTRCVVITMQRGI